MANPAAPAVSADVAAMLTPGGVPVIDGASAAGISLPPGAFARPPRATFGAAAVDGGAAPAPAVDPAAAFKAAVAQGLAVNAPTAAPQAALAPATGDPVPPAPVPVVGATVSLSAAPRAPATVSMPEDLPVYAGDRARSREVLLSWPILWRGELHEAIVITRPTAREVGAFFERLAAALKADPTAVVRFPIYRTRAGQPVPDAVMDALDDDDLQDVLEEVSDFLPRRLRPAPDLPARDDTSTPGPGADTEARSAA